MEFREADTDDVDAIREVAHASLHASYDDVIGEEPIHDALDNWYDPDELAEDLATDGLLYVLAVEDDEVVGFSQSFLRDSEGRIQWLHVHPDHRGHGLGSSLLEHTRNTLAGHGVEQTSGAVLAEHEAGNEFYGAHGFSLEDQRTVEVGGELHAENLYVDVSGVERELEPVETSEGEMYVDRADPYRGKAAPFFPVYRSQDGARRWGWFCDECGSTDTAMDSMDRVVCNDCGNVRKADRWDAAYL